MRRGRNHKRINITIDRPTWDILMKYKGWGTPTSALIRKAVQKYDGAKTKVHNPDDYDGVDIIYD